MEASIQSEFDNNLETKRRLKGIYGRHANGPNQRVICQIWKVRYELVSLTMLHTLKEADELCDRW